MAHPFDRTRRGLAAVVAVSAVLTPLSLSAQRSLGAINGQVQDASGAKVPGAEVTATEGTTHFTTTVKSDGSGAFTMPALNAGTYTLTISAAGFATETRTGVLLTAGQLQVINVDLKAGVAGETVEVQAQNSLLDNGSPNIATTLSQQEVTDLPNNGRNPYVLATLGVGIVNGGSGGYFQGKSSQFTNPFSGVAVQIGANGSTGHNRLTLNGIPNDPPERFSGATYSGFTPSPEAVQEVKVQTSIFDAQVGHGNGTVTETVVRSGSNAFHGSAYYVFHNTYLNANTYERVANQNLAYGGTVTPTRRLNDQLSQTGAVVSGPVIIPKLYDGRDKTHFMVAYERYLSHSSLPYNSRVPTAAERTGDFSGLCNTFNAAGLCTSGIQIYDPQSPINAAGNRTAYFAGNIIPASRIDAAGAALLSYYPLPNVSGSTAQSTFNYISNQTSYRSSYPSLIGRIDQQIGEKDKIYAIAFTAGLTQSYPLQGFPKGIAPSGYGYSVYRKTHGGSLDEVHQFNSTMVLDSRFGLVYHPFGLVYPGAQNFNLGSININGNYPYTSFPGLSLSDGYSGLAAGAGGQVSASTNGSLEEVLTKSLGRHNLRLGFEGNLLRYNVQNPQSGFGTFSFTRQFTQQNYVTASASSGDPTAALLLGAFSSNSYNITPAYALQQIYAAPFVQDDWRVNDKLTLNLGFRWDYESPFTERYNKMNATFDTAAASPLQVPGLATLRGGLTFVSANNRFQYPRDLNNFQPRIGFAYQATPSTVVRGGYGIIFFNTLEASNSIGTGFAQSSGGSNTTLNTPINTLSNPFPNGVVLPTGNSLGLATALGTNINFTDPNHVQPYLTQYVFNVQQQLFSNLVLEIGYVGQQAKKLEVSHDINVLPQQYYSTGSDYTTNLANQTYLNGQVTNPLRGYLPSSANSNLTGTTIARSLLLRPYPQFGSITENYSPIGATNYNALQIQVSKPMRHHFSIQGNLAWNKLMTNGILNNFGPQPGLLARFQDPGATLVGKIWGTVQGPAMLSAPAWQRLPLGGWSFNFVMRAQNGSLVAAPGGVDQIGNPVLGVNSFARFFNTCYQNAQGVNVATTSAAPGCDSASPNPAFRQRLSYTIQTNNPYINVRQRIYPLEDFSAFKKFNIREGVSFEIRGEFFNILNRPNFNGPSTGIGSATYGSVYSNISTQALTQANDPRIGQLTGRINF